MLGYDADDDEVGARLEVNESLHIGRPPPAMLGAKSVEIFENLIEPYLVSRQRPKNGPEQATAKKRLHRSWNFRCLPRPLLGKGKNVITLIAARLSEYHPKPPKRPRNCRPLRSVNVWLRRKVRRKLKELQEQRNIKKKGGKNVKMVKKH